MSVCILVVDDEPDVESLFRQQFRRDIRSGRFLMELSMSAPEALERAAHLFEKLLEERIVRGVVDGEVEGKVLRAGTALGEMDPLHLVQLRHGPLDHGLSAP